MDKPDFCIRKSYLYIQAFKDDNGDIAFRHTTVKAFTVDDAYYLGMSKLKDPMLNDYVVEIPDAE